MNIPCSIMNSALKVMASCGLLGLRNPTCSILFQTPVYMQFPCTFPFPFFKLFLPSSFFLLFPSCSISVLLPSLLLLSLHPLLRPHLSLSLNTCSFILSFDNMKSPIGEIRYVSLLSNPRLIKNSKHRDLAY